MANDQTRDVIVVGGSAGGIEALEALVSELPHDLDAAVFVVVHLASGRPSALPPILGRATTLPVEAASDGLEVRHGRILVAPPDHHLVLRDGRVGVVQGPRENGHRPAIDPLFRSAAHVYGPRVIGVVLSGNLDDGTAGLVAVKRRGGLAVVEDPDDALYPDMPANAIAAVDVDHVSPIKELGGLLASLVGTPTGDTHPAEAAAGYGTGIVVGDGRQPPTGEPAARPGRASTLTCPDCAGVLDEVDDGGLRRYRCRVGHAWSPATLLDAQGEAVEAALWTAIRAVDEQVALLRQLLEQAERSGRDLAARSYLRCIEVGERHAAVLRQTLGVRPAAPVDDAS